MTDAINFDRRCIITNDIAHFEFFFYTIVNPPLLIIIIKWYAQNLLLQNFIQIDIIIVDIAKEWLGKNYFKIIYYAAHHIITIKRRIKCSKKLLQNFKQKKKILFNTSLN